MILDDSPDFNVKLRGSGQIINLSRMPDGFIDALHDTYSSIEDPLTIIASWAYMFTGLSIDEIRERFIVMDNNRAKIVSREYIRQKIKTVYEKIQKTYKDKYGDMPVSTLYYDKFTHTYNYGGDDPYIYTKEEINETESITEEEADAKKSEEQTIREEDYEEETFFPEPEF